jgi:phage terminase large subunit-like protein
MARPLAQVWAASNAGDRSSVVLHYLRKLAHAVVGDPDGLVSSEPLSDEGVDDESLGIFEWSAPPGCDLDDRAGWAQANPSLGHTITERAIRSARRTDPESVFRVEVLCQWVTDHHETVIPLDRWLSCEDAASALVGTPTFAVDVSPQGESASIAAAGRNADGVPHVEIVENRPDTGWLVPRLVELSKHGGRVVADPSGPAGAVVTEAKKAGLDIETVTLREHASACGALYSSVVEHRMRHLPDALLDAALEGATKRDLGDGAWLWSRKSSLVDISPLVAATLALAQSIEAGPVFAY